MFALSKASCALRSVLRVQQSLYSTTSVLMEKFNIVVPPMGESVKSGIVFALENNIKELSFSGRSLLVTLSIWMMLWQLLRQTR